MPPVVPSRPKKSETPAAEPATPETPEIPSRPSVPSRPKKNRQSSATSLLSPTDIIDSYSRSEEWAEETGSEECVEENRAGTDPTPTGELAILKTSTGLAESEGSTEAVSAISQTAAPIEDASAGAENSELSEAQGVDCAIEEGLERAAQESNQDAIDASGGVSDVESDPGKSPEVKTASATEPESPKVSKAALETVSKTGCASSDQLFANPDESESQLDTTRPAEEAEATKLDAPDSLTKLQSSERSDSLEEKPRVESPVIPGRPKKHTPNEVAAPDVSEKKQKTDASVEPLQSSEPESATTVETGKDASGEVAAETEAKDLPKSAMPKPVIPKRPEAKSGASDADIRKAPPPKPKKLSSKIAAFQQMFNQTPLEQTSKPEVSRNKLSSNRSDFAASLQNMVGRGFPMPGMASPELQRKEESAKEQEEPAKEPTRRAKGPRGKRLPKSIQETKVEVEPRYKVSVVDLWEVSLEAADSNAKGAGNGEIVDVDVVDADAGDADADDAVDDCGNVTAVDADADADTDAARNCGSVNTAEDVTDVTDVARTETAHEEAVESKPQNESEEVQQGDVVIESITPLEQTEAVETSEQSKANESVDPVPEQEGLEAERIVAESTRLMDSEADLRPEATDTLKTEHDTSEASNSAGVQ